MTKVYTYVRMYFRFHVYEILHTGDVLSQAICNYVCSLLMHTNTVFP